MDKNIARQTETDWWKDRITHEQKRRYSKAHGINLKK